MNEFIANFTKGMTKGINSDFIQKEVVEKLLEMKLQENPNMTIEEWEETKQQLMVYLMFEVLKNNEDLRTRWGKELYKELNS